MNKIKPCPLCGDNNVRLHKWYRGDGTTEYEVRCKCGFRFCKDTEREVISTWNMIPNFVKFHRELSEVHIKHDDSDYEVGYSDAMSYVFDILRRCR